MLGGQAADSRAARLDVAVPFYDTDSDLWRRLMAATQCGVRVRLLTRPPLDELSADLFTEMSNMGVRLVYVLLQHGKVELDHFNSIVAEIADKLELPDNKRGLLALVRGALVAIAKRAGYNPSGLLSAATREKAQRAVSRFVEDHGLGYQFNLALQVCMYAMLGGDDALLAQFVNWLGGGGNALTVDPKLFPSYQALQHRIAELPSLAGKNRINYRAPVVNLDRTELGESDLQKLAANVVEVYRCANGDPEEDAVDRIDALVKAIAEGNYVIARPRLLCRCMIELLEGTLGDDLRQELAVRTEEMRKDREREIKGK